MSYEIVVTKVNWNKCDASGLRTDIFIDHIVLFK